MKTAYIVEQSLASNPEARNSDKVLLMDVWEKLDFGLSQTQRIKFLKMPSAETITRIRRKLQEEGGYPADKTVKKSRDLKSMVVQQNMPKANLKTTDHILEEQVKLI